MGEGREAENCLHWLTAVLIGFEKFCGVIVKILDHKIPKPRNFKEISIKIEK